MLKPTKAAISQSKKEYNSQLVLTTTDAGNSYFSEKSGGYLIAMKGHNLSSLEAEAGKYLADFGLQVHLTPEGAGHEIYATHSYVKDGKTHYKFPEGKINMFTFEQKTPSKIESSIERSVRQAILHANSKHADIARHGKEIGLNYAETWSCYKGGEKHCGKCGTCVERKEALHDAGIDDPTEYED